MFAGITDIQGLDFYVAGCAPHVTSGFSQMRIQGSYEYLLNTRNNQMPLMTWGYTQAFYDNIPIHGNELVTQAASVIAAGCHGIMLFQSNIEQKKIYDGNTWNDAANILSSFFVIREELRKGDIDGAIYTVTPHNDNADGGEIISIIRSIDMLIIIVINTDCYGYSDIICATHIEEAHWKWNQHIISNINITIPKDFRLNYENGVKFNEIVNGTIMSSNNGGSLNGVTMEIVDNKYAILSDIVLQTDITTRIFAIPQNY